MATSENVTAAFPFEGRRSDGAPGFAGTYSAAGAAGHFKRSLGFDGNDANRGPFNGVFDAFDISAVVGQRKVQVEAGAGMIAGRLFYLENSIQLDVPSGARKDRLIARVYRSAAINIVELAILEEVLGSGVYTPLTQDSDPTGIWEIPLFKWESPAGTADLTTVTFTDDRYYANLSTVTAPEFTNVSGADFEVGTLVVQSTGADQSVNTTTTAGDPGRIGVAIDPVAASATGKIATSGIALVRVTGAVARGDRLAASSTAGYAQSTTTTGFARALTANAGGLGAVWAHIGPQQRVFASCMAYTSGHTVASGATSTIQYTDADIHDTDAMHDPGGAVPSRIYAPVYGYYAASVFMSCDDDEAFCLRLYCSALAGMPVAANEIYPLTPGINTYGSAGIASVYMAAGQYVYSTIRNAGGSSNDYTGYMCLVLLEAA